VIGFLCIWYDDLDEYVSAILYPPHPKPNKVESEPQPNENEEENEPIPQVNEGDDRVAPSNECYKLLNSNNNINDTEINNNWINDWFEDVYPHFDFYEEVNLDPEPEANPNNEPEAN
jgi:hypothetical protein